MGEVLIAIASESKSSVLIDFHERVLVSIQRNKEGFYTLFIFFNLLINKICMEVLFMGKFNDTKYVNTIDSLVDTSKSKINNPYYKFTDKPPTKVTYYSQNIEKSTLDPASGLNETFIGDASPIKYNKINNFIIYGIDRMSVDYDLGENGIEAAPITGEGIILPNSITPRPGDFFHIDYLKEDNLITVTAVTPDTLDTGSNIYKIEYQLSSDRNTVQKVKKQVEKSFEFIANNVGTDFKMTLLSDDYKLIKELESVVENLIVCFNNTFFKNNLQTFIYNHDGWFIYDPFMIEFLIRNKVFTFGNEYVYVSHACTTSRTFGMDYNKTFFYSLENPDKDIIYNNMATADLITDPNSLFVTRMNDYYSVNFNDKAPYKTRFQTIPTDVIDHIKNNELYERGNDKECYNLWINYFNDKDKDYIRGSAIDLIQSVECEDTLEYFYKLGITIFIIEQYIKELMK